MFHKKHLLILIVLMAFVLAACGGSATTQQAEPTTPPTAEQPMENEESMPAEGEETSMEENENEHSDNDSDDMQQSEDEHLDDNSDEMADNENEMPAASASSVTLVIVPEESEARFIIDEILNGADKKVVGTTTAVEGTISADKDDPSAVSVSAVKVDMSTLSTDSSFRNRAIRDFILHTGDPENQFATFEATSYEGLPGSVTIGEPFTFQITGDLTIHGVTHEETFEVTLTPVSDTRIEGTATLSDITYADYSVQILRLPEQVASVEDTVTLELSFVAVAQ
jgi:polyisoprenoid-binding protein YceI